MDPQTDTAGTGPCTKSVQQSRRLSAGRVDEDVASRPREQLRVNGRISKDVKVLTKVTDHGRVDVHINDSAQHLSGILKPVLEAKPPEEADDSVPTALSTSPAPMNIVIHIVGSRGDVQPFVSLGRVLKNKYAHRVRIATHLVFKDFVEENGLEFFSIGGDPAELMAFMVKNPGLIPDLHTLGSGEVGKQKRGIHEILVGCWRSCIESGDGTGLGFGKYFDHPEPSAAQPFVADAIIANPPSFAHVHCAEKLGIPLHLMFTMPWSPTQAFPHPLVNIKSSNANHDVANFVSYILVDMITWSPALIPKPKDWGSHISISGFYFLSLASAHRPDPALTEFLAAGPKPVYIGVGSIVVDDPDAMTKLIFKAIKLAGVRALVSKGWGGLGAHEVGKPDEVFMLGNIPHDWLFEHVSAVVHHGGAGTTAAGIAAGKPSVIVPFFGDQHFWGSVIARAGAGPAPIAYKDLTAELLAEQLRTALGPEALTKARELGARMSLEEGAETGAGLIHMADLKLCRHREYEVEDGPWDPVSGVASVLLGTLGSLMLDAVDLPGEAFHAVRKRLHEAHDSSTSPTPESDSSSFMQLNTLSTSSINSASLPGVPPTYSGGAREPDVNDHVRLPTGSTPIPDRSKASESEITRGPRLVKCHSLPHEESHNATHHHEHLHHAKTNMAQVLEAGLTIPMNLTSSLAQGFHNAPKIYGDHTVRQPEKISSMQSGSKAAGKDLGHGLYDGISGLVTQPVQGVKDDGATGLLKGMGKGLGGLVLKPGAAIFGVPADAIKGVYKELQKVDDERLAEHITSCRMAQGREEAGAISHAEEAAIVERWTIVKLGLFHGTRSMTLTHSASHPSMTKMHGALPGLGSEHNVGERDNQIHL
ncbi:hypothetical protein B0A49_10766 [Cryomyces minteri]|uniref:Uncharacterized protein n=1 Tax=Cryomyces minteri TaxID=331657 RepID=A0A4U0WJ15_9PEZI|nr:hypothetical protein B0A49_10766 [Cryomyces minteri]